MVQTLLGANPPQCLHSRTNGTNLSLICKAVALFLKSLLLQQVQSLKFVLLSPLFTQEIDNLLLLLFNLR